MRHVASAALICSVVALPYLASPASASSRINECGDLARNGAGIYNVTSRNIGCRNARVVARRVERGCRHLVCRFDGWTCRTRLTGDESADTRCTKRSMVVRFQSGA